MRYALHLLPIHIHGRHSKFSRCSRESAWLLARNYRCVPGSNGHAACRIQKLFPERRMTAHRIGRSRSDALMVHQLIPEDQQARPHRLGGSQQGAQLRGHEDNCAFVPTCVSVAPCSGPSRRGLQTLKLGTEATATASLDGPCARCPAQRAGRDEGTASRHEQRNCTDQERAMT